MSELILHHYPQSPFAEKARLLLGFKGLSWRSVLISPVMPKPDLIALTGGYRKTPVLQIGADIYCDTALIAHRLEQEKPGRRCFPKAWNWSPRGSPPGPIRWCSPMPWPWYSSPNPWRPSSPKCRPKCSKCWWPIAPSCSAAAPQPVCIWSRPSINGRRSSAASTSNCSIKREISVR